MGKMNLDIIYFLMILSLEYLPILPPFAYHLLPQVLPLPLSCSVDETRLIMRKLSMKKMSWEK